MYTSRRVLIFGKTYPELSSRYIETVCTGAITEDGKPLRLYPVPLRYLEGPQQYKLYEWVTVPMEKSTKDPRPESYRIRGDQITKHGVVGSDQDEWQARRDFVFRDQSWHFSSMAELKEANRTRRCSIGFVKPGTVDDVKLLTKTAAERKAFAAKRAELEARVDSDMFHPDFKSLEFLPHEIQLRWRCTERCETCRKQPHSMKVLDWGLLELARRDSWAKAVTRMEVISDLSKYDFHLYLGTFRRHMSTFGIIGLWYPKMQAQRSLFSTEPLAR